MRRRIPVACALVACALVACASAAATERTIPDGCRDAVVYAAGTLMAGCTEEADAVAPLIAALRGFQDRVGADDSAMRSVVHAADRTLAALRAAAAVRAARAVDLPPGDVRHGDARPGDSPSRAATPVESGAGADDRATLVALVRVLASAAARAADANAFSSAIVDWRRRYLELFDRWILLPGQDLASRQAYDLVAAFRLEEAAAILDSQLAAQEQGDTALAALTALRDAQVHDLTDAAAGAEKVGTEALYAKAHGWVPDDLDYLAAELGFLRRSGRPGKGIRIAQDALDAAAASTDQPSERLERRARILAEIGILQRADGRPAEARAALVEARDILRRLAAGTPEVFDPALADVLDALGDLAADAGAAREGASEPTPEDAWTEARGIRRRLAAANAAAFEPGLATTLGRLGDYYRAVGRDSDAEASWSDERDALLDLARSDPTAYGPQLVRTLEALRGLPRRTQPAASIAERQQVGARDVLRLLAADDPGYFEPDLARALGSLGDLYLRTGRADEAEKAFAEGLAINRRLAAADPARFDTDLAQSMHDLCSVDAARHRYEAAKRCFRDAIAVLRPHATTSALVRTRSLLYLLDLDRVYVASSDAEGREALHAEFAEYLDEGGIAGAAR